MPRQPRLDAPGTLHQVIGRGIEGTKIFRNRGDREDFLDRLAKLCEAKALSVYAWALLGTHFHLLVRSGNQSLSHSMRRLLTGYVVNFNRRHKRYGHLFQNRYKSILCEEDPYLLELTRYIHLNPLRARMVKNFKELRFYPWSGHSAIMGKVKRGWQDVGTVLEYFGRRKRRAIVAYEDYVREGMEKGRRPELVGGGLIRSLGGWSEVLSLRRKGEKTASDDRILAGKGTLVQTQIIIDNGLGGIILSHARQPKLRLNPPSFGEEEPRGHRVSDVWAWRHLRPIEPYCQVALEPTSPSHIRHCRRMPLRGTAQRRVKRSRGSP
jgi:REP element-mobilizing transposase RayT